MLAAVLPVGCGVDSCAVAARFTVATLAVGLGVVTAAVAQRQQRCVGVRDNNRPSQCNISKMPSLKHGVDMQQNACSAVKPTCSSQLRRGRGPRSWPGRWPGCGLRCRPGCGLRCWPRRRLRRRTGSGLQCRPGRGLLGWFGRWLRGGLWRRPWRWLGSRLGDWRLHDSAVRHSVVMTVATSIMDASSRMM